MRLPVVWSPRARSDFVQALDYIHRRSPQGAATIRSLTLASVERAAAFPEIYRAGRVEGTREAVVHANYLYVYAIRSDHIQILRFLHARRQYP